jgi:hypothetical protein
MVAVVWHFWIGFLLSIGVALTLASLGVGYLTKVQSLKYPKKPYVKKP